MRPKKISSKTRRDRLIDKIDHFFSAIVIIGILAGCMIIIFSKGLLIYNSLNQSTVTILDTNKHIASTKWTTQQMENDMELSQKVKLIEKRKDLSNLGRVQEILKIYPIFDKMTDFGVNIEKSLNESIGSGMCLPNRKSGRFFREIEKMKNGHVGVRFWMAFAPCENQELDVMLTTMQQVDMNRRLIDSYSNYMEFCTTSSCIINASFHKANGKSKIASLVGVEVGPIMQHNLGVLRHLYHMGVRYVTLTQFCEFVSNDDPVRKTKHVLQLSENGGYSRWRLDMIYEMNRMGFIIELHQLNEETLSVALRLSKAPVVLSQFGENMACNEETYLDDYLVQLLKRNGGLIIINFNCNYIYCNDKPRRENLDDIIKRIDYLRKVVGINYIGVGGLNDGVRTPPKGLEDSSKYPKLFAKLIGKGWKLNDVRKVAFLNMLRVMEKVERVKKELQ